MESGYERSNSVIVETASTSGQRTIGDFSSLARGPVWLVSEHCDRPRTCDSIKVKILAAERRRMCWVPISAKRSPRVQSGLSSCRLFKHKRTRIATGAPGRSVNQKSACFFARYGAGSRHTDRHGFSSVQRLPSYDWWNFIVDTGHVPSWPLMEIRRP